MALSVRSMKQDSTYAVAGLGAGDALLARLMAAPGLLVIPALMLLAAGGWIVVFAHAAGNTASLAPWAGGLAGQVPLWLQSVCAALLTPVAPDAAPVALYGAALAMWSAMALAMMLPAAAPMILTYAELSQTALEKGRRLVSVSVLAAGYLAVWLVFAALAAGLQTMLALGGLIDGAGAQAASWLAALLLAGAGVYQFSALKAACLVKCRTPFMFFMANWRETTPGIFGLGLRQGLACLGCCWALMLVMLGSGVMNLFWMLALSLWMIMERLAPNGARLRRAGGAVLFALAGFAAFRGIGL